MITTIILTILFFPLMVIMELAKNINKNSPRIAGFSMKKGDIKQMKCFLCNRGINGDYFDNGKKQFCSACLKQAMVYYALKSLGLIYNTEDKTK